MPYLTVFPRMLRLTCWWQLEVRECNQKKRQNYFPGRIELIRFKSCAFGNGYTNRRISNPRENLNKSNVTSSSPEWLSVRLIPLRRTMGSASLKTEFDICYTDSQSKSLASMAVLLRSPHLLKVKYLRPLMVLMDFGCQMALILSA